MHGSYIRLFLPRFWPVFHRSFAVLSATLIAGLRLLTHVHRRAVPQWAAQFAHFCATGRFRCLAVTWQNFHPDLPDAPTDELEFAVTLQRLAATIQQAGLR